MYYFPQTACAYMQHITQMYYLQMRPLVNEEAVTLFPSTLYQNYSINTFVTLSSYIRQTYLLCSRDAVTGELFYMLK